MRRRRANIFGDLRISSYTPPSFDMITRVFENALSSGSTRNENAKFDEEIEKNWKFNYSIAGGNAFEVSRKKDSEIQYSIAKKC